jgi:hypothetical protein
MVNNSNQGKHMKRTAITILVIGLFISSCNLPAAGSIDPQIATAAALTVQAAVSGQNTTPLASPADAGTGATPTYSKPIASVGEVTNCRTGPGTNYERVTQLLPNESVDIIGFYPPNYWIVSSKAGPCWLSAEFTTPIGSFAVVPTVTAPATPAGNAPQNISWQKWDILCDYQTGSAEVTLRWSDKSESESGYRVTRNGDVIAELPANSTTFKETITLLSGQSVGYGVIGFNAIGSTSSSVITLNC